MKVQVPVSLSKEFYILYPLGVDEEGAVKFEIKANVKLKKEVFLRSGYSANAEINLETIKNVLAIKEGLL